MRVYSTCREVLYEDKNSKCFELAALVASKVYYHLGAFEDSLTYALGAGAYHSPLWSELTSFYCCTCPCWKDCYSIVHAEILNSLHC